jgi:urease accessory protein
MQGGPEPLDAGGLLRLMSWLSPAFPVGSFSYSHGIEQAVEAGFLRNPRDLVGWVSTILRHGSGWIDAVLFVEASRAILADDRDRLAAVGELSEAWRGTAETALESRAQGAAFQSAVRSAWPEAGRDTNWSSLSGPSYGLAVAIAAAAAGIDGTAALTAFLHAVAANLVSAAVRLIPLGQTDGQRALAALADIIPSIVAAAGATTTDDLGSSAPMVDWTSMRHETQYTRLFRS